MDYFYSRSLNNVTPACDLFLLKDTLFTALADYWANEYFVVFMNLCVTDLGQEKKGTMSI